MKDKKKQKLMDLGSEQLANALLHLASQFDEAHDFVEHLIATPKENIQRFKKKISSIKRSSHFINWDESYEFGRELSALLQDLKAGVDDPLAGVQLVADFYKADKWIFERCDDSNGDVGDVFRYDAKALFIEYASQCSDKEKVADIILKLNESDDYGVRDILIDCAEEYLPEPILRSMIETLQKQCSKKTDEYGKRAVLMLIESLAKQVKDPKLFEQTRIESWGKMTPAAVLDIARIHLDSGNLQAALSKLLEISDEPYMSYERDSLLMEIYRQTGDNEKLSELLYQRFHAHHSIESLQELLDVMGNDKRHEVISKEIALIFENKELRTSDAEFLISLKMIDETEKYLLERAELLEGDFYSSLIPLADTMESEERYVVASLIYRSLLLSILKRGYTKAYPHGIRYLKKLDVLAASINQWEDFDTHEAFKMQIRQDHGRKRSFWSKYD